MSTYEIISVILSILAFIISGLAVWYTYKQYLVSIKPDLWSNTFGVLKYEGQVFFDIHRENTCAYY